MSEAEREPNQGDTAETLRQLKLERLLPTIGELVQEASQLLSEPLDLPGESLTYLRALVSEFEPPRFRHLALLDVPRPIDVTTGLEVLPLELRQLIKFLRSGRVEAILSTGIDCAQWLIGAMSSRQHWSRGTDIDQIDQEISTRAREYRTRLEIELEKFRASKSDRVLNQAETALAHAKQAAGLEAGVALWESYAKHATVENRKSVAWLGLLFAAIAIAWWIAYLIVFRNHGRSFSEQEVGRLVSTVPLLLLAAYASRQAHFHRSASARSRNIELQLRTAPAFTDALPAEDKREVMKALGMTIFGGGHAAADPPSVQFGLLAEGMEAVRALGGQAIDKVNKP